MNKAFQLLILAGSAYCCLILSGCGEASGPKTISASGSVSYKGDKIRVGTVTFAPADPAKAQATMAEINEGTYRTAPGHGLMVGEYKVVVTGLKRPMREIDPKDSKAQAENYAVPKKYTDVKTTDLTVTVTANDSSIKKDLDLKD